MSASKIFRSIGWSPGSSYLELDAKWSALLPLLRSLSGASVFYSLKVWIFLYFVSMLVFHDTQNWCITPCCSSAFWVRSKLLKAIELKWKFCFYATSEDVVVVVANFHPCHTLLFTFLFGYIFSQGGSHRMLFVQNSRSDASPISENSFVSFYCWRLILIFVFLLINLVHLKVPR